MRLDLGWPALLIAASLLVTACSNKDDDDDDDGGSEDLTEYGPENSYPHAYATDVPEDLAGTGWSTGDIAHNFTLVDQNADEVELYQFYGSVVVIDNFTEW